MSPTILRIGKYRFFFNSREETGLHVHVATADGTAKFWLEPIVALANYYNLQSRDLRKIEKLVQEHQDEFKRVWHKHFKQ